ncbi:response regulator, partial [Megamonas funiformis]|uniref:response regulator n=1 Tax=Megamonas funiformis TaxID=437897 RepID=UPI003C6D66C5
AKTIPIIAMTANAFEEDAKRCLAAGMTAHLAKPFQIEDMEKAILEEETALLQFTYTQDVMDIMTKLRREWNLVYPEEM